MSELTFENTKKIVETPDYKIQINDVGEGHPIFMIHGTGPGATGWSNFAPNIKVLSQKYRCIAVTMPGWGESSPQSIETGHDQDKAMMQLQDTLGIDKAAFVGNSMGGVISCTFTALHSERVSHLITMGAREPGAIIFTPAGPSEGIRVLIETYENPTPENFKRLVKIMCFDQANASDEIAEQRAKSAQQFPEHNKNWLDIRRAPESYASAPPNAQVVTSLMKLPVPALVMHGRDDKTVHFENSLRLVSMIPNARMVLMNHCGHWLQLEHAAEFNRLVDDFITNN